MALTHKIPAGFAFLALAAGTAFAVGSDPFIVTTEVPKDSPAPSITGHDVVARVGNQPATVSAWHSLRSDPAGLELWILIDDGIDSRVGVQFEDVRNFVRQQPPETRVAIGYLRNGTVETVQRPTTDRQAAVKAIRLPTAIPGISASPYIAVGDFLHKLPASPAQPREIVLISSGVDPYYGPGPENPYLLNAIHDAQKAGVPVNSIYFSSAGHAGHSFWAINWGQNDLSELSDETGGEFYWEGNFNPVAFKPFFDDLNRRFSEQYIVRVDVPKARSGTERLQLHTESPHVNVVAPKQVYFP